MAASLRETMLDIQMTQMFSNMIESSNLLPALKTGLVAASQQRIHNDLVNLIDVVRNEYDDDDDDDDDACMSIIVLK